MPKITCPGCSVSQSGKSQSQSTLPFYSSISGDRKLLNEGLKILGEPHVKGLGCHAQDLDINALFLEIRKH